MSRIFQTGGAKPVTRLLLTINAGNPLAGARLIVSGVGEEAFPSVAIFQRRYSVTNRSK
jgi:hypothetical protein